MVETTLQSAVHDVRRMRTIVEHQRARVGRLEISRHHGAADQASDLLDVLTWTLALCELRVALLSAD